MVDAESDMADLQHLSRILYNHTWRGAEDWARSFEQLADLTDKEIGQLEGPAALPDPRGGESAQRAAAAIVPIHGGSQSSPAESAPVYAEHMDCSRGDASLPSRVVCPD
jgi:hypothetical protein